MTDPGIAAQKYGTGGCWNVLWQPLRTSQTDVGVSARLESRSRPVVVHQHRIPRDERIRPNLYLPVAENVNRFRNRRVFVNGDLSGWSDVQDTTMQRGATADRRSNGELAAKSGERIAAPDISSWVDDNVVRDDARIPIIV